MTEKLSEFANYELGEAFFEITNSMIVQGEIPFSRVGDFELVSPSWRKLADKVNKTQSDIEEIDITYKNEIKDLADSCILYMAIKLGDKSYKFDLAKYKQFIQLTSSNNSLSQGGKSAVENYNKIIETQFKKLANHGEPTGDNLIDNKDMAAYIYALDLKSKHSDNNEFEGFYLNGKITPLDFAVAQKHLKEDNDNLFTLKLRHAYKNLFEN